VFRHFSLIVSLENVIFHSCTYGARENTNVDFTVWLFYIDY